MTVKTWRILDRGTVPDDAVSVPYACVCGAEAMLPVQGRVIAQLADGVVFDTDQVGVLPATIQCRKCGRILTNDVR